MLMQSTLTFLPVPVLTCP